MNSLNEKRPFDELGSKLAHIQAEGFAAAKGPSKRFILAYMKSEPCRDMDSLDYFGCHVPVSEAVNEINGENENKRGVIYEPSVMHWIGFMYRYWAYTENIPSPYLAYIASPSYMASFYNAGHTASPEKALEMIQAGINDKPKNLEELYAASYK